MPAAAPEEPRQMTDRRRLIAGSLAAVAAAGPAPAIAQDLPELRWRMTSSFPRSLDTIYGAGEIFVRTVAELTGGRFRIDLFPAGEIVPGLQALDAVSGGAVECCHTASYYYVGKDPTFAFATAIPFALNARGLNAWLTAGGAMAMLEPFYARYGVRAITAGNSGAQMGGWFRKEIAGLDDLAGLKMRIGGFAGQVLQKLGVVPQQIAPGDVYPALERGAIDAAEWVGPYDDEKLGFDRVAPYYYYPGFWDGGPALHVFVARERWEALPAVYRAALETAGDRATLLTQARYDALNPPALRRLVAKGAMLRPFPAEVMTAAYAAAGEVYAATAAANPEFGRVYDHLVAFRDDQYLWWQVAEYSYDGFMIRARNTARR